MLTYLIFTGILTFALKQKLQKFKASRKLAKKSFIDGSGQQLALLKQLPSLRR
jgi:hypothetical protein